MIGIDLVSIVCCASIGGIVGGALAHAANRSTNRCNIKMLEIYLGKDIKSIRSQIYGLEKKISTISVDNPVSNQKMDRNTNGYSPSRYFKHGD